MPSKPASPRRATTLAQSTRPSPGFGIGARARHGQHMLADPDPAGSRPAQLAARGRVAPRSVVTQRPRSLRSARGPLHQLGNLSSHLFRMPPPLTRGHRPPLCRRPPLGGLGDYQAPVDANRFHGADVSHPGKLTSNNRPQKLADRDHSGDARVGVPRRVRRVPHDRLVLVLSLVVGTWTEGRDAERCQRRVRRQV